MPCNTLTIRSADIRPVSVPLRRPVVSKVGRFEQWTVILIDLQTEEGPVGRSYLEPYLKHSARYLIPAIHDLVDAFKGTAMGPVDVFEAARRLYWFEEPIAYDHLEGYARLTRELKTPVQLGENFYGPRSLYQALQAGAGDLVMPDLGRIGGVTGWLRAAAIAGSAGIPMSTHLYPETSAHLMRVTETAHWLEWQDWADPIVAEPFALKDGHLIVPNRPGNGLAWNEQAVKRYRYDM